MNYLLNEKNLKNTNNKKSEFGITLIALVITIIVLLILAGISIMMLTGDNSILKNATDAKGSTEISHVEEAIKLAVAGALSSEPRGDITDENIKKTLAENMPTGVDYTVTGDETTGWTVTVPSIDKIYAISNSGAVNELGELAKLKLSEEAVTAKTTITESDTGYTITIPEGFTIKSDSPTTIKDGVVVVDAVGNEFVWVPVPDVILDLSNDATALSTEDNIKAAVQAEIDEGRYPMAIKTGETDTNGKNKYFGVLYDFSTSDNTTTISIYSSWNPLNTSSGYREPAYLSDTDYGDASTTEKRGVDLLQNILGFTETGTDLEAAWTNQMQNEFDVMVEKVAQAKGYYVGRYEMSGSATDVQSKPNVTALTAATTYNDDYSYTWYGLYKAGKNYIGNSNVGSSMIWGSQYDQMMIWMTNNGLGEYVTSSTVPNGGTKLGNENTGKEGDTDIINNIYDLYGGNFEWTMEARNTSYRVSRGSNFGYSFSPRHRVFPSSYGPFGTGTSHSSRFTLYVK